MFRRIGFAAALLSVSLIAALLGSFTPAAADGSWTPFSCENTVTNYPVNGGTLTGRGCAAWWTGSELKWEVWGDTSVPQSYAISTYVSGSDSCDGVNWQFDMSASNTVYNAAYGTSGNVPTAPYQNCTAPGQLHHYQVYGSHSRQAGSGDPWEGSSGWVYFG